MKKTHFLWLFFLLCVLAFVAGGVIAFVYSSFKVKNADIDNVVEGAVRSVTTEEETVLYRVPEVTVHYVVVSKDDSIVLLEVESTGRESVVEKININKNLFPYHDIMLLEEGMVFSDKAEALMMIENFVS